MIYLRAEIKGEPDAPPFAVIFQYADKSDEQIFCASVNMIQEKLAKNLKINTNESLVVYCAFVVRELRAHKSINNIEKNATKVLSADTVMIGVPETLRRITFEAIVDNLPKKHIILKEPIPTMNLQGPYNYE